MALLATGAAVAGSLLTRPTPEADLVAFYKQVHPPGFWGRIAVAAGHDPKEVKRRMFRSLGATFAAGASVLLLIVGLGTWMLHAPGPTFIHRGSWIALCVIAGIGLIALWWKLADMNEGEPAPAPSDADAET
jgi:hypothetical protein